MTTRNRYSTAPTYGAQKRPVAKKQAPPQTPPYAPGPQAPYGQQQMPPAGYAAPGYPPVSMPPQQAQSRGFVQPQAGRYVPPQPAYAGQAAGYGQQAYVPPQQAYTVPPRGAAPAQPTFYPPQQTYPSPAAPQEYGMRARPRPKDYWLQVLLLGILPFVFLLSLLLKSALFSGVFIGLAALTLGGMWLKQAFVPSARMTLTLVYGALMVVAVVTMIANAAPGDLAASSRGNSAANRQSSAVSTTPPPQNVAGNQAPTVTPTPAPSSGEDSEAWQRLEQFFNYWMAGKQNEMLTLVSPSWSASQDNVANAMFIVRGNRTPLDYTFESISGSDADTSRTITMTATIDKNNGRDPVKIRFQAVMLRVNNEWYVDPNSLKSNDEVATATPDASGNTTTGSNSQGEATATPKATATPAPKLKLYYNSKGGAYYHSDSECSSVDSKYFPLDSFYYKDINNTKYKHLLPCPKCKPPARP